MPSYNKIILMGNLTRDPLLSYLPSETPVCEFGLAVNRRWKKDGQDMEEVCFVDCRIYGKQAETFNQYMEKGKPVLVEGRLQFDRWEKDGQKRSKHRVNVQSFQFIGGRDDGQQAQPRASAPPSQDTPLPPAPDDDDIPF